MDFSILANIMNQEIDQNKFNNQDKLISILKEKGSELFNKPFEKIDFTKNPEIDEVLNNIERYPHLYVLACVMDRQIKAERAWSIPYEVSKEIGSFEFTSLFKLKEQKIKEIFVSRNLHRFNKDMSKYFYLTIQRIHNNYANNASNIWKGKPSSATIVKRFLEFDGAGVKIATMAANILARDFKIPMRDYFSIDISPDVHITRVFTRLRFITNSSNIEMLIYTARELNPEWPGIFDLPCWQIGRNWCNPKDPICKDCYLTNFCPKFMNFNI
ncbi:MAG: hypothetical protein DDT42_00340 [candidate division WS2 bacterium]|uniref:Iron-sulfur cluster loop n=1 Tax=Psychracetigena formicireducens TaxID=2986056 RepID=A0A9E2BGC7_PSYF1|nr:hypothetical protein [Candidatus Psychracetigena formicireducens]MBT9144499.1 hypothetical protein [Candidatus Psychracetigena formicireducens]